MAYLLFVDDRPVSELNTVLPSLTDAKKVTAYPHVIDEYCRYFKGKDWVWFEPPFERWQEGGLEVRVNPELGLEMGGTRYLVKLHFNKQELSRARVSVALHLLGTAVGAEHRDSVPAIFDIPGGRLLTAGRSATGLDLLLKSEVAAFMSIWDQV